VGDVADEIAAHGLQAAHAGQVLQDDQVALRARLLEWGDDGLQEEAVAADLHHLDLLLAQLPARFPQLNERMVGRDLGEGASQSPFLACVQ